MKLPLAYYGHPILRKKTARIEKITPSIIELVNDMIETMNDAKGCGLAAPQVHHSLAVFITCVPNYEDEDETPGVLRVFINPKILEHSQETWISQEGCLSIPRLYRDVERPSFIKIEATDLEGNVFQEILSGMDARVFMHENDHINGVLYIDRLPPKEKKEIEPFLREIKKKYGI